MDDSREILKSFTKEQSITILESNGWVRLWNGDDCWVKQRWLENQHLDYIAPYTLKGALEKCLNEVCEHDS